MQWDSLAVNVFRRHSVLWLNMNQDTPILTLLRKQQEQDRYSTSYFLVFF